jgi:protocatechuate 3,4-dioxygenase beta subunit
MPNSFFARRARGLLRRSLLRPAPTKLAALPLEAREVPAVGGFAFQDYNANGVLDAPGTLANLGGTAVGAAGTISTATDAGVGNITVTVFDAAGAQVGQTTTAAGTGAWSVPTGAGQYRVEFTGLAAAGFAAGPHGPANGTTTQFVMDGAAAVNLGLVQAATYFQNDPLLVTSRYTFGTAVGNTESAIISFPYSSGSTQQANSDAANRQALSDHAVSIPASQVGTTWGLGFNRQQRAAYAAAYAKRHSGLGPGGTGAIYTFALPATDTPNSVTTAAQWINLEGLTGVRDAATNALQPAVDTQGGFGAFFTARTGGGYAYDTDSGNAGWNAVGKSSLGGLDVSADGGTVYVMNLADRRLYIIPVLANGAADAANVRSIAVPTPAGADPNDVRPWAVQARGGLVYVGLVDSAESDQNRTTLRGYVYAFDTATNAFGGSLVNDAGGDGFDLSYARGSSFAGSDDFRAWSPTYNRVQLNNLAGGLYASQYPQPIVSGLAFDTQGNLTISIRDRNGDQTGRGAQSNGPEAGPPLLAGSPAGRVEGVSSGDLLKAFADGGTFDIEANGRNPNNVAQAGTGVGSGFGPGGGEFYGEDDYGNGGLGGGHGGTSLGGVTQLPGFGSVVNAHFDPLYNGDLRTGGIRWFDADAGGLEKSYQIYSRDEGATGPTDPDGTFGKANGLGDLIAIANDPPVEIGNRVFRDTDRDGVQDPGEPGIRDVIVQLQDINGNLLATAKTAADGSYYFSNGPGTTTDGEQYGVAGLANGAKYQVVIPNVSGTQQVPLTGLILTTVNAGHTGDGTTTDGNGDLRNSDFALTGTSGVSVVNLIGNAAGNSVHTSDAGFIDGVSLGDFVWEDSNNDGDFDAGVEAGIAGVTVNLYQAAAPNTVFATQQTVAGGGYLFTGLLAGDYIVEVVGPAGFRSSSGGGADLVNGPFESALPPGNSLTNEVDHGKAVSGNNVTGYVIRANTVTLAASGNPDGGGFANLRQDFGLVRTFSLGNRVWLDKNNSGTIDAADGGTPGIDGATVRLYRPTDFDAAGNLLAGATALRTTTTANGGYYRFDDLLGAASAADLSAGSYVVVVDAIAGARSSTGTNGSAAGPFEPAPTLIGAPTTTDSDDSGTTVAGGLVRSGVAVVGPGATLPTGEGDLVGLPNPQGTADAAANMTVDFGFFRPLALGNFVFEDANNNGTHDAGEAPLANVAVQLIDALGKTAGTTTTDANGAYLFTNLSPGQYTVRVTTPAGFTTSTGVNGGASGPFEPAPQTTTNNVDHGTLNATITAGKFVDAVVTLGDVGAAGNPDTIVNPNDANLRQDFGFFRPLALGDFVFEDRANNGVFDGADTPVAGVLVELLDATNAVIGSRTTLADGLYRFDNLVSGNYTIRITPPAGQGYASSTGANGQATGPFEPATGITANNADHGTTAGGFIATTVTLLPAGNPDEGGAANLAQDFGLYRPVLLGNLIWRDANNNGAFDPLAGETGIGGVAVDLLDSAGTVLASTTTDGNGLYQFPVTPGQYRVRIAPPAGLVSSTGNGPGPFAPGPFEPSAGQTADGVDRGTAAGGFVQTELITVTDPGTAGNPDSAGFANLRQDFGLYSPIALALGNLVFEDANNNGVRDAGEPGIPGATVTLLDAGGNPITATTTDGTGNYRFDNLPPGTYTVLALAPAGFRNSDGVRTPDDTDHGLIDPVAANKATSAVTLTNPAVTPNPDEGGTANLRQDFGFFRPQAIGNFVFIDANNNGSKDAGEVGKAGVAVQLVQGTSVLGSTTTGANGNYLFPNLTPGTYTVRVTPPAGFSTSTGKNGSPTGPTEPGLTDATDNADHGTATGTTISANVTLTAGATNPDGLDNLRQDFGLFQPLTFGDTVFADANKNGTLDAGEKLLPNVPVQLTDGTGTVVGTVTTGTDGKYQFTNLTPGTYTVQVTPPAGFTLTPVTVDPTANAGNQNVGTQVGSVIQAGVTLLLGGAPSIEGNTNGNNFVNGDFGLVAPPSAKVSGFVYRDPNLDGQFVRGTSPNGDTPIGAVTVTLFDNAGVQVGTTKTDNNGFYQFTGLLPGTYTIVESQPAGLLDGLDTPGSLGGTSPANDTLQVTLAANDDGQNYNFGEYQPTQVSGYVWVDANLNCQYDRGSEITVANVPVTISGTAFAGTPFARPLTAADVPGGLTVRTDARGRYLFPVLPPGVYTVTRGDLPAEAAALYADGCEQIDDRATPAPAVTNNQFSNVTTIPAVVRGSLNFGLISVLDPTKRQFLGSSGGSNGATTPASSWPPGTPNSPTVPLSPAFGVGNAAAGSAYVIVSAGAGLSPQVRVFDYASGGEKFRLQPYESTFTGGVRVAQGDVTGDGIADIVTTTGVGGGPRTRVYDGATGNPVMDFFAFESTFRGGTFVTVGDVNADGFGDVIVGAEVGGGPRVTTFSGKDGSVLNNFFAFDSTQRGGTRVAAADFNGDGRADIVATTGKGVPTRVRVFDGTNVSQTLRDFAPFEASFTGGVNITAGDFNGDGTPDIGVGAEVGGGPRAQIFDGKTGAAVVNTFAFEATFRGGVRVAAQDVNGDGRAELVATPGPGGGARVRVIDAATLQDLDAFYAFEPNFVGGAYVG